MDGQQRLTALFHAYFDSSTETVYYGDSSKIGEPDVLRAVARRRAEERLAQPGVVLIRDIAGVALRSRRFQPTLDGLRGVVDYLREALPGLVHGEYQVPVLILPWDVDIAALAKILETVNRSGIKLNAFDLMVAILFPQGFNLREEWAAAQSEFDSLVRFDVDGVQMLRLIALWQRAKETETKQILRVRGIRQSDVLRVPGDFVSAHWRRAACAFDRAIDFGAHRLGIVHPKLVPSDSMLLTMAALLEKPEGDSVESWFWRSCLTQAHSQGANTQVVADFDKVEHGATSSELLDDNPSLLRQPLARNAIVARGLCCALVQSGALDLATGQSIADSEPTSRVRFISVAELLGLGSSMATVGDIVILTRGSQSQARKALHGHTGQLLRNLRSQRLPLLQNGDVVLAENALQARMEAQTERSRFFADFVRGTYES